MKCCVPSCKQSKSNQDSLLREGQITFYEFPTIPWLRKSWLVSIGMNDSHLPPDAVVCSLHFQKDNFNVTSRGNVKLRRNSIPSVFKLKRETASSATSPLSSGQFCIICLNADCKLFPLGKCLAKVYINITGLSKNIISDNSESELCTECAQRLINCYKFKNKILKTYKLLIQLYEKHGMLTLEKVKVINREEHELTSNIVKQTIKPNHFDLFLKEDFEKDSYMQEENSVEQTEIKTEMDGTIRSDSEVNSETSDCLFASEKVFFNDSDGMYNDLQDKACGINNDELIESDVEYAYENRLNVDESDADDSTAIDNYYSGDFNGVSRESDDEAVFLNYDDINDDGNSVAEFFDYDPYHVGENMNLGTNNVEEKKVNNKFERIKKNAVKNVDNSPDRTVIKQLIDCCENIIKYHSDADIQANNRKKNDYEARTPRSRENSQDVIENHNMEVVDNVDFTNENSYTDLECLDDDEIDEDINNYTNHDRELINEYDRYVKFVNENIRKEGDTNEIAIDSRKDDKVNLNTKKIVTLDNLVLVRKDLAPNNETLADNETKTKLDERENKTNNKMSTKKRTGYRPNFYGTKNIIKLKSAVKDRKINLRTQNRRSKRLATERKVTNGDVKADSQLRGRKNQKEDSNDTFKMIKVLKLSQEEQLAEIEKRKETHTYKNSRHQCDYCYKGFLDNETFTEHMERHTDKFGLFECAVCRLRSKTKRALTSHFQMTHSTRFSCTKCSFVSNIRNSARMHERWHEGVKYRCPHCGDEFTRQSSYMLHVRIRHPSDSVCTLCGFSFIGPKGLTMHMNTKHHGENTQDLDGPMCEECDIIFASDAAYEQHMKVSPKHAPADKLKRNSAPKYRHYKQTPRYKRASSSKVECEQCGVVVEGPRSYFLHFRKHHPDKNRTKYNHDTAVMCEQCGKVFRDMTNLRLHMPYHAEQKQFKCDICDKRFALKTNLAVHVAVHKQERCECAVCGKFLSKKSNLMKHMMSHQEPRLMYECNVCDKSFTTMAGRREHLKHVHGNVPYKPRVRSGRNTHPKRKDTR